jgi:hypothetical protein
MDFTELDRAAAGLGALRGGNDTLAIHEAAQRTIAAARRIASVTNDDARREACAKAIEACERLLIPASRRADGSAPTSGGNHDPRRMPLANPPTITETQ